MKKLLLTFLVLVLCVGFFSCEKEKEEDDPNKNITGKDITVDDINDEELYDAILGEFATYYAAAKAEKLDVNKRYALMAIAEAKLLESGVFLPIQANGGNYAISKAAPYSVSPVLWGNDEYKYHDAIVCTEFIKNTDRVALKALYNEYKGTGNYATKAIEYLTGKGYTIKDTYSVNYTSEPDSYDQFASSKAQNAKVTINLCDGLLEYNTEGIQVCKLAESYTVSEDGLTYTFKLKQGVKWTDSTGKVIGEVTADDFVAGFQHLLDDPTGQLEWLVEGVVAGVTDYVSNQKDDFSGVGVKAVDTYTVQYTLENPCSYFLSMFSYTIFNPLNRAYYVSKGGVFGYGKYTEVGDSYTYAKTYEDLCYCGPYLVKSHTAKNEWTFEVNPNYYDVENVRIKTIKWVFADASVATQAYDNAVEGKVDGSGLGSAALAKAKTDGNFEEYCYISSTGSSSFPGFLNLYRRAYENFDLVGDGASTLNKYEAIRTNAAMANKNFRLALLTSIDRAEYLALSVGEELKYTGMVNSYTPGTFVALTADTTVEINGKATTYKAGTYYGAIMQDQITADGYSMKVWDPTADDGVGSSGGFDGWHNVEEAKKYLAKAIEELKAAGTEVSAENPIKVEFTYLEDGSESTAQAAALAKTVKEATDGCIIIALNGVGEDAYYNANYYFDLGKEANYGINTLSGWGPDYGDPSSYLDTMYKGGGYMVKCLGLDC